MNQAYICDAIRTPFGRYGGALSGVRADDLGAVPIKALIERNPQVDWSAIDDVLYGCANQAGEDNRNVARMSGLLAGLPVEVPGGTINRLCGSGLDAIGSAARAIKSGEARLMIAGGVESMSRAPFVMPKAESAFSRSNAVYDTTIGWRFVNKLMKAQYGVDSMPETAENVAVDFKIEREAQDLMAYNSQLRAAAAIKDGHLAREICPVIIPQKKGDPVVVDTDEHPRATTLEALAKLKGVVRPDGSVTAGNASGVNDGACALLLADGETAKKFGLTPKARVVGMIAQAKKDGATCLLDGSDTHYSSEHRMLRKDGAVIWVLDRGRVVQRDAQGRAVRVVGAYSDISERRHGQIALENAMAGHGTMMLVAEQTKGEIFDRMLAKLTGINGHRIKAFRSRPGSISPMTAEEAAAKTATAKGLSAATVEEIKKSILGIV